MADLTRPRLTWSNALTGLRLIAAPFFCHALWIGADVLACGLFWLAVATDLADGRLARARGEASSFGGLLDHATDALFVSAGLLALAARGAAPLMLPLLVLLAFAQYALDSRVLAGRPLRGSALGRWNGILYFVPPGVLATRDALGLTWPPDLWLYVGGWLLVGSTLVSMTLRLVALGTLRRETRPGGS